MAEPAFTTRRLRVFRTVVRSGAGEHLRAIYLAFQRHECPSWPLVTATVLECEAGLLSSAEWLCEHIVTVEGYRCCGYATELWRGIEEQNDRTLRGAGVTRSGTAFYASLWSRV